MSRTIKKNNKFDYCRWHTIYKRNKVNNSMSEEDIEEQRLYEKQSAYDFDYSHAPNLTHKTIRTIIKRHVGKHINTLVKVLEPYKHHLTWPYDVVDFKNPMKSKLIQNLEINSKGFIVDTTNSHWLGNKLIKVIKL